MPFVGYGLTDMAQINLNHGLLLLDDDDADIVSKHKLWSVQVGRKNGVHKVYAQAWINGKSIYVHRLLIGKSGLEVDHVNGNGLDCRRINLRVASRSQNGANKAALGGSSKYKGVCRANTVSPRWRAWIMVDKVSKYLGSFRSEIDAAIAYDTAAKSAFGCFAHLNFKELHNGN